MRLGTIMLWGDDVSEFRRQVQLAEALGYDVIGVGDSPAAWHDLYVSLTVAAMASERATLTPMVTTPFLRHPSVTANAISSLHELTGGRTVLTIGSGGSALRTIGRPNGATQQEMRDYVSAVRSLLAGGQPQVGDFQTAVLARARPVPVFVSADGPKGLTLAGALGDGVVISVGTNLDLVRNKITRVREAAAAAGRDPDDVQIWGMTFVSVRATREEAMADVTAFLASTAGMGLKAPHMRALIPPELRDAVLEMERRYDATQHVVVGGANAKLLEALGLVTFVAGLNSIAGNEAEVVTHLRQLEELGVSCVFVPLPGNADPEGTLTRFAAAAGRPAPGR
jgi:5,10-methylenetetrahydromethanopterin reductase